MRIPPRVIGNRQDQQISVIGFTKRPTQLAWTGKQKLIKNNPMEEIVFKLLKKPLAACSLTSFLVLLALLVSVAAVLRYIPSIPEPCFPIKTPFGKLPFFDGVILYGAALLVLLSVLTLVIS
jgi:hypothetical protein